MTKKQIEKRPTAHAPHVRVRDDPDTSRPEYGGPKEGWDNARLKEYGLARLDDAERHEGSALLAMARAGEAFAVVRDRLKPKHGWVAWLKGLGVRRQRAWRATKVHEGASREAAMRGLSVEEVVEGKTYTQAMEEWVKGDATGGNGGGAEGTGETDGRARGVGEKREAGPGKETLAAPRGKEEPMGEEVVGVEPNGEIQIDGEGAIVRCGLLRQVSKCDGGRKLLVVRNWDARARAALARQMAVLLVPELDDRCLPTKEGVE